jgi:GGDEF domain-containing protein
MESDGDLTETTSPPAVRSVTPDQRVVRMLATGAAPGAIIEEAANAVRVLYPDRGLAVWYRGEDGTATVQAAGIGAHLVMITGDPDSPFWTRARNEKGPNYEITFHAHPEDVEPTSVWCVPVVSGPVAGELTLVVVGPDDGTPLAAEVRTWLEHLTRLLAVGLDRQRLVDRLDQAQDQAEGHGGEVETGLAPTRGSADEAAETAVVYLRLRELTDVDHIHGHKAAEELTVEVGRRLSGLVRPDDTVARLSATDFCLRCYRVTAIQAEAIAERVLHDRWTPIVTRWERVRLRPLIGLTRAVEPTPLSRLMHDAEQAMVRADRAGRNWMWDTDETDPEPLELEPGAPQSEPGRLVDSDSGSPA